MSHDRPSHREVGRRLLELGPRLWHAQRHILVGLEPPLSYRQYRVLSYIAAGRTTLTALSTPASVGLSTLSEIVDSLARRGLVERTPSIRDRRAVELTPTDQGRSLLAEAESRLDALADRLVDGLPEAALRPVGEAVDPINATVQELLAEHHSRRQEDPAGGD